jgi:hypothetical protein
VLVIFFKKSLVGVREKRAFEFSTMVTRKRVLAAAAT